MRALVSVAVTAVVLAFVVAVLAATVHGMDAVGAAIHG